MNPALLVDLYELTMAASYLDRGMNYPCTFDLSFRELPLRRNFLISCGLEQALDYLESFHFEKDDIEYFRSLGFFKPEFLDYLSDLEFTGEVWGIPEGEAFFPFEPVLRVTAPLIEAQIVETFLINCLQFQTMIASKAARVAIACDGRPFVDFSARRDHGPDAALYAARASFVGGASGTSNVQAGKQFGLPVSGTMAHAYVMAFPDEGDAFEAFAAAFPDRSIFLIDTFDTIQGAKRAARVAKDLSEQGIHVRGVRLDSGDLRELSREVRKILDEAGLSDVEIFASGDLDEYRIAELVGHGDPIDAFGVGTQLGTSGDAPWLGGIYKLVEDPSGPKLKLSTGKVTLPGKKQVHRIEDRSRPVRDLIALENENPPPASRPLLEMVMLDGERSLPKPDLETLAATARKTLENLPAELRSLQGGAAQYRVDLSATLEALLGRSGA